MTMKKITKNPPISGWAKCIIKNCDGSLIQRYSKYGPFFGCSNYPLCNYTRSYESVKSEYMAKVIGDYDFDESYLEF